MSKIPLKEFLGDGCCLIIEPSTSFSANILGSLQELGVPFAKILTARRFIEAKRFIEEKKPKFVVMEYDIPEGHALSLIELIESQYPDAERIVFVVTKNSSDSAVADAAEGSVDSFLLKPFSIEVFRQKLADVLQKKMNPSPYSNKLFAGRQAMLAGELDQALLLFNQAKPLDSAPSLACYYAGEVYLRQNKNSEAVSEFREGRRYNSIHYKCLIREFEVLMNEKKFTEAYELVALLKSNYPISANRLGQIFAAAVYSRNFDDLSSLYELYLAVDQRTPQLVDLTALAFFTAGRYWTQKKDFEKATPFFELGLGVKGRDLGFLEKIVDEFLKAGGYENADFFLTLVLPQDVGTKTFNGLKFKVDRHMLPPDKVIERGRRLVSENQATPEIYLMVVESLVGQEKLRIAEGVVAKALMEYPEMRTALYGLLESKKSA